MFIESIYPLSCYLSYFSIVMLRGFHIALEMLFTYALFYQLPYYFWFVHFEIFF